MTPLTKASLATSTSGCPANISPDVDPALCDPASFERAPDEFVTEIDAGFGKMKVRVCDVTLLSFWPCMIVPLIPQNTCTHVRCMHANRLFAHGPQGARIASTIW
jgi:hypothetical protein